MIRSYSDLVQLRTFEERFDYLNLDGKVCQDTFGFDRYLNQIFYRSKEWRTVRNQVIIRDNGCDLGIPGMEIGRGIVIHHMNPITVGDIESNSNFLLNPEYLICVSERTHEAIHYGNRETLPQPLVERRPNDTCPWKTIK